MDRQLVSTGSPWEPVAGYSRAVRTGDLLFVAGTTASAPDGSALHPDDPGAQAREALRRIVAALGEVGATVADVVQTRMYVTDIGRWEEVARAHGELFAEIRPATAMVEVSRLISPGLMVEIEAVAVIGSGAASVA